jgi:hypothetical protein
VSLYRNYIFFEDMLYRDRKEHVSLMARPKENLHDAESDLSVSLSYMEMTDVEKREVL